MQQYFDGQVVLNRDEDHVKMTRFLKTSGCDRQKYNRRCIENRPGVNFQWIFRLIMTLLSCWILITLLNFDTFLSRNSTGRRYVDGSEFPVKLWPRVKIPRWIMTPGQNSTLNCDPNPRLHINLGHNSTWNQDPVSQFNVESRPVDIIPREILIRVTIQRGIMTRGHNSTLSYDPGSQFNVELWSYVQISRWIMTRS